MWTKERERKTDRGRNAISRNHSSPKTTEIPVELLCLLVCVSHRTRIAYLHSSNCECAHGAHEREREIIIDGRKITWLLRLSVGARATRDHLGAENASMGGSVGRLARARVLSIHATHPGTYHSLILPRFVRKFAATEIIINSISGG